MTTNRPRSTIAPLTPAQLCKLAAELRSIARGDPDSLYGRKFIGRAEELRAEADAIEQRQRERRWYAARARGMDEGQMSAIPSGRDAMGPFTPAAGIDWSHVIVIELWSVKHAASRQLDAPGGLNIEWMTGAGVRYAVVAVFEDDTWVWTSLEADAEAAIRAAHRLAAEHGKPVRREAQGDEVLGGRGTSFSVLALSQSPVRVEHSDCQSRIWMDTKVPSAG